MPTLPSRLREGPGVGAECESAPGRAHPKPLWRSHAFGSPQPEGAPHA